MALRSGAVVCASAGVLFTGSAFLLPGTQRGSELRAPAEPAGARTRGLGRGLQAAQGAAQASGGVPALGLFAGAAVGAAVLRANRRTQGQRRLTAHKPTQRLVATLDRQEEAAAASSGKLQEHSAPALGPQDEELKRRWDTKLAAAALAAVAVAFLACGPALADDAAAVADAATEAVQESGGDWFDPFVNFNIGVIGLFDEIIEGRLGVSNTFGWSIIGYTILVKLLTFPLNQSSLRSNALMQLIQPKVAAIQQKYKNDQETANRMLLRLYDDCGVNPLGGFLPSLIQFPVFIALYRAINKLAQQNSHFQEPFLWIPSLAGPVEVGKPSMDWLLKSKFEDHFEPLIGWDQAWLYLILPVLLVVSQFFTQRASSGPTSGGPAGAVLALFPLFIGYTCMVSPSGLGVYWLINNLLTQAQTFYIRSQLGEEFPAYKKILDGTAAKETEEKMKVLEDLKAKEQAALEAQTTGKGFSASLKAAPAEEPESEAAAPSRFADPVEMDPEVERRRAENKARRKAARQRKR